MPLHQFTAENLCTMIGQGFSLPYLVPLALERLEQDPWTADHLVKGALLRQVLRIEPEFWHAHFAYLYVLSYIMKDLESCVKDFETEMLPLCHIIEGA